jgi:HAE1 family hydrophobic/amphiphilic exporter-1
MRRWSLSDLALNRPVTVGMTLVALFLLGLIATFLLPLSFMPSESASRVEIEVDVTRTSPEVLEREVIRPLEENVAGVRDLRSMRVSSGSWGVNLHLEFEPGTDIDARKLELRERLDRVRPDLPELVQQIEVSSSMGPSDEPMMELQISADRDLAKEYYLLERKIVRPIERIEGVSRVEINGVQPHELEVAVDVEAAKQNAVPLQTVSTAVRTAQRSRSLGTLRDARSDAGVRSPAERANPETYSDLPLARSTEGAQQLTATGEIVSDTPVVARLDEVAAVTVHPREQRRGSRLDGKPAVNISIYSDAGASVVEVSEEIRQAIDGLRGDPALGDLNVIVFMDQGEIILETLGDLRDTGFFGGIIGIFVLFCFLHRWRTTLAASLCIPLSVLAACGVLFMRGEELNCVVLLGLVLGIGMLIDNAVVIVEAIQLRMQKGMAPAQAARFGAREVGLATIASTMSSVIVFLPMIIGETGNPMYDYLRPLGATFVTALVASLLISQSVVPLLMGKFMKRPPKPTRHRVLGPLSGAYGKLISLTLRWPRLTLLVGLCISATALVPGQQMELDMGMDERSMSLPFRLEMTGSTSYKRVESHMVVIEDALLSQREELGIKSLTCRYRDWGGRCNVYPLHDIESETEMSDLQQAISDALPEQAGVRYHVGEREGGWRRNRDPRVVEFVLRGEDMGTLMTLSKRMAEHLETRLPKGDHTNPDAGGYDEIFGPFNEGHLELQVKLDSERLNRLGLRAEDVSRVISLAFQGVPLGQVRGEDGELNLRLSSGSLTHSAFDEPARAVVAGEERSSSGPGRKSEEELPGPTIQDLHDLPIPLPDGGEVPLSSISEIELAKTPWWIQRANRATEVRMKVRFFGTDMQANRAAVEEAREGFSMPDGYSAGRGTSWWREKADQKEMLINLALSLILVYAVMASLFESFLQPMGILVTCLLGCVGAPWALYLTQTTLDTVALIGLFILIGIVVNNGIMLVDKITQLRAAGMERDAALRQAGQDRLRPILMTAATTILGLVPMLIHHPTLAGIYYHSIAILIAGGLMTSTFMTLVFLPSAYVLIEDFALNARARWRRILR